MKKRNLKSLQLNKKLISTLENNLNGGLIQITKINVCGSQIDACPSALGCTYFLECQVTYTCPK